MLIGLSRELGFEFKEDSFDELCEKIYQYIHEFKRKRNLLSKEQDKEQNDILRIISSIKDNLTLEVFSELTSEKFREIRSLEKELKAKKITFKEYWKKLGESFD